MNIFSKKFIKDKNTQLYSSKKLLHNKVISLNKLIYDKDYDIRKLSELCFDKLRKAKNVCIVGNGRAEKNISQLIDKFDVIIRFNDYTNATDSKLVGKKTDIHFLCLINGNKEGEQDHWIKDCDCTVIVEIHRDKLYADLSDTFKEKTISPSKNYISSLKNIGEITRGFYAIGLCLQVKESVNKDMKIYIIGFGGKGHHLKRKIHISHYHQEEMILIEQLINENKLIDLHNCGEEINVSKEHINKLKAILENYRNKEDTIESRFLNKYKGLIEDKSFISRYIRLNNGNLEGAVEQIFAHMDWRRVEGDERRRSRDEEHIIVPNVDPSILE